MMALLKEASPGLKRKKSSRGIPALLSRYSIWLISSKLITAPRRTASMNSSAGVLFEVKMISSPLKPTLSARISSGRELQSAPIPSSFRIFRMVGLGQALTAK